MMANVPLTYYVDLVALDDERAVFERGLGADELRLPRLELSTEAWESLGRPGRITLTPEAIPSA